MSNNLKEFRQKQLEQTILHNGYFLCCGYTPPIKIRYRTLERIFHWMRPEDSRLMIKFIENNGDTWNELVSKDEEDIFIDNFIKSRNTKLNEGFFRVGELIPGIMKGMERIYTKAKIPTESPIEDVMVTILDNIGLGFEAQKNISKYRVDFFIKPNLIIECDGQEWHKANLNQSLRDYKRDKYLMSRGYITLRFSGHAILNRQPEVKQEILSLLKGVI